MAKHYDFGKLLDVYKSDLFLEDYHVPNDYKYKVEHFIEINNPDFITVLNLGNAGNPIVYSKNFNIKFPKGSLENIHEIMDGVDKVEANRIYEADRMTIKFLKTIDFLDSSPLFQLRFMVSLIEDNPITILREMVFIPNINNAKCINVILVAFTDITSLDGVFTYPRVDIKHHLQNNNEILKIEKFKKKLSTVLLEKKILTKREGQILDLIAEGKSSAEIAKHLNISANTVNTHRQNLIRKFGVKNINALINSIK